MSDDISIDFERLTQQALAEFLPMNVETPEDVFRLAEKAARNAYV